MDLAEKDVEQRGLEKLSTPIGSAGSTEPRARQLDEEAWARALAKNSGLLQIEREYERARAALERAQESFKELPAPRFYIR